MDQPAAPAVLALVRDLMFMSKIRSEFNAAQRPLTVVRDPAKLGSADASLLLVDLTLDGALDAAVAWKQATHKPVIGFIGHTETEMIQQARAKGVDQVMTRGQFTGLLPQIAKSRAD